jgi:hypothetical protein
MAAYGKRGPRFNSHSLNFYCFVQGSFLHTYLSISTEIISFLNIEGWRTFDIQKRKKVAISKIFLKKKT